MMEGGMLFAGAAAKKLESAGDASLVCPFCLRLRSGGEFEVDLPCEVGDRGNKQPRAKRVVLQVAPHRGAASSDAVVVIQRSLCQLRSQKQEERKNNWHSREHQPRAEHVVSMMNERLRNLFVAEAIRPGGCRQAGGRDRGAPKGSINGPAGGERQ